MTWKKFWDFLAKIFAAPADKPTLPPVEKPVEKPPVVPPVTTAPAHAENPAYKEAKKHIGKTEHDSAFNKYLSAFWVLCKLPHYKTIVGSSFAWCALFIVAMNSEVGQEYIASASAKAQGKYGTTIDWQKNGIPSGSVIHVNHGFDCKSSKSNHVTFADGDCTAEELLKPGANFPGLGGNQGNTVKRSMYPVKEICHVGWPKEIALPAKIVKSVNCSGKKSGESTQ